MRLACMALGVLLVGCQALPAGDKPTVGPPTPGVIQAAEAPLATGQMSVWGEMPKQCVCHDEPLARLATNLRDAQLPADVKIEGANGGWQLFSITFDPARVSSEQVTQVMKNAGALIITAPAGAR